MTTHDDIEQLAEKVRRHGLEVTVDVGEVAASLQQAIVRLTHDALTNIDEHGTDVTRIDIRVSQEGRSLHWSVSDDGALVSVPHRGRGLAHIGERVFSLGGSFDAGRRGTGWSVAAVIPVDLTDE